MKRKLLVLVVVFVATSLTAPPVAHTQSATQPGKPVVNGTLMLAALIKATPQKYLDAWMGIPQEDLPRTNLVAESRKWLIAETKGKGNLLVFSATVVEITKDSTGPKEIRLVGGCSDGYKECKFSAWSYFTKDWEGRLSPIKTGDVVQVGGAIDNIYIGPVITKDSGKPGHQRSHVNLYLFGTDLKTIKSK